MPPDEEEGTGDGTQGQGGTGDGGTGDGHHDQGGGAGVSHDELVAAIREVLGELGIGAGGGNAGDEGAGDGADGSQGAPKGRLIDQEAYWEQVVRRELERVRAADDIGSLKEEVRKIVERPPKKFRRVTRIVWGGDE